jgi:hypothetical protein
VELLFVILISAAIGLLIRYITGGRDTHGLLLLPSISAAVTAVVWEGLLWLGWKFDGTWIWVVSLVTGGVVALILGLVLPRSRRVADRALLTKLSGGKA